MGRLQIMKIGFMHSNGLLQLLDVFRPALSEGCLGLTVSLLPLLGGSIYLEASQETLRGGFDRTLTYGLPTTLSFLLSGSVFLGSASLGLRG